MKVKNRDNTDRTGKPVEESVRKNVNQAWRPEGDLMKRSVDA